jgi:hypothetical protein
MKINKDNQYQNQIFPITYFQDNISNNDELKGILLSKIKKEYEQLEPPKEWLTNKVHTSFSSVESKRKLFFDEDQLYEKFLDPAYGKCFDHFFDKPYQISIDNIWYNYYVDDQYQEWHTHLGDAFSACQFSCIHFLSFNPKIHEPPVFSDPCLTTRYHSINIDSSGYGEHHSPKIVEGDFIMFPSYLQHCVYPVKNTQDYPRITIALNIKILEYGYDRV